jgi:hypothetical protein
MGISNWKGNISYLEEKKSVNGTTNLLINLAVL